MNKNTLLAAILLTSLALFNYSFAEPLNISISELTKKADLVISGKVIKVARTEKIGKIIETHEGRINYATIQIDTVLKGKVSKSTITVDFIELQQDLEADVQEAQFVVGDKGTAYLEKLPNGHYRVLGGWTKGWHDGQKPK